MNHLAWICSPLILLSFTTTSHSLEQHVPPRLLINNSRVYSYDMNDPNPHISITPNTLFCITQQVFKNTPESNMLYKRNNDTSVAYYVMGKYTGVELIDLQTRFTKENDTTIGLCYYIFKSQENRGTFSITFSPDSINPSKHHKTITFKITIWG